MTDQTRNPDIDLDAEKVPKGMVLIKGEKLQNSARNLKIPFGVASAVFKISPKSPEVRRTVGIILRRKDLAAFRAAQVRGEERRAREAARLDWKSDRRAE